MAFESRTEAGRKLGARLREAGVGADLVLGLPRGGVVVAAEVARELNLPLDVFIVRKIGHPLQREFAIGALAEPDVVLLDEKIISRQSGLQNQIEFVIEEEKQRLREYRAKFHAQPLPELADRSVLLVDDGLATGATAEAAARGARQRGARKITVAAPVASPEAVRRLLRVADDVRVLISDPDFAAVGEYYRDFEQTTDTEVMACLRAVSS